MIHRSISETSDGSAKTYARIRFPYGQISWPMNHSRKSTPPNPNDLHVCPAVRGRRQQQATIGYQPRHCRNDHQMIHIHSELSLLVKSIKMLQIWWSWQIELSLIVIFEQMAFVSSSFRQSRTRTYCHSMSRPRCRTNTNSSWIYSKYPRKWEYFITTLSKRISHTSSCDLCGNANSLYNVINIVSFIFSLPAHCQFTDGST